MPHQTCFSRRRFMVASLSAAAIQTPVIARGATPVQAAIERFGRYVGSWPPSAAVEPQDIVQHGGSYYFCIAAYTPSPQSADPERDDLHWELLPHFNQATLFDDDFGHNPGPFNGRRIWRYKWYTTGVGYQTAVVRSGCATAAGNTYFVMPGLPPPITEFGVESAGDPPLFTLAIGGTSYLEIFARMLHVNFASGGANSLWWDGGKSGQPFANKRYSWTIPCVLLPRQKATLEVSVRGNLVFAHVNGLRVMVLCDDLIPGICAGATQVFFQNHQPSPGLERHYRAWAETWSNPKGR